MAARSTNAVIPKMSGSIVSVVALAALAPDLLGKSCVDAGGPTA